MKRQTKFTAESQPEHMAAEQQSQAAHEFASAEEMLRHDAIHTPVPPGIEQRLQKSVADLSPPKPAWWRRFLGGTHS